MIIELRGRISKENDLFTGEVLVDGKEATDKRDRFFVEESVEKLIESVVICDRESFVSVLKKNSLVVKFISDDQAFKIAERVMSYGV